MTVPPEANFGVKSSDVKTIITKKIDNTVVEKIQPQPFSKGIFEDSLIRVEWEPTLKEFAFELTNKTDHTISINWDEVVYVDENNMPINVMHKGIINLKRNETQKPSIIPTGTTHRDFIIPTENVNLFKWNMYNRFGYPITFYYWHTQRIYEDNGGGKCAIHMPITIQSLNHSYTFTFEFTDPEHKDSILDWSSHNKQIRKAKTTNKATLVASGAVIILVILTIAGNS
jgi:hypothetical protein